MSPATPAIRIFLSHSEGAASRLRPALKIPTAPVKDASKDWWLDAVRRPLGAYYRVDARSITDMRVALNETGILYTSTLCHTGWMTGLNVKTTLNKYWQIPPQKALPGDGDHAFIIVGYTSAGFIIQNSWGTNWSSGGRAILTYEDWLDNAMDCWVAQIGVVTDCIWNRAIAHAAHAQRYSTWKNISTRSYRRCPTCALGRAGEGIAKRRAWGL